MDLQITTLGFIGLPGNTEWIVILALGLLIFGKRLPEVGKSLGRSIVEFKKGLKGVKDEIDQAADGDPDMLPPPDHTPDPTTSHQTSVSDPPSEPKETMS